MPNVGSRYREHPAIINNISANIYQNAKYRFLILWRKCIWRCRLHNLSYFVQSPVCWKVVRLVVTIKSIPPSYDFSDAVAWWRHQMETFCALLALCVGKSPVTGEFPSQRPVMFSLICAGTNDWVNNRGAGELKRHSVHYDVTVMDKDQCAKMWRISPVIQAYIHPQETCDTQYCSHNYMFTRDV